MQKLFLAEGIHICALHDGVVVLDLHMNRYFGIHPDCIQTLNECLEGFSTLHADMPRSRAGVDNAKEIIDSLLARRALTHSRRHGHPVTVTISNAVRAVPPGRPQRSRRTLRFRHIAAFSASYLRVLVGLKMNRLPQLIVRLRSLHGRSMTLSRADYHERLLELLARFRLMRTFVYTADNKCLFNALVLADFLNYFAFAARFYIGVRSMPFLAHAWVEVGDCVVDDCLESLQGLTPLLVA